MQSKCAPVSLVFGAGDLFGFYSQLTPASGSTRWRIAPRQIRTTSSLRSFSRRLSFTNLSMAQKQMAPTTTMIKTAIRTESMISPVMALQIPSGQRPFDLPPSPFRRGVPLLDRPLVDFAHRGGARHQQRACKSLRKRSAASLEPKLCRAPRRTATRCVSSARRDLCGGQGGILVPTATYTRPDRNRSGY
jgi:hypothetical protein